MKGLILLFLAIVGFGIGWTYCSRESRNWAKKVIRENLLTFIFAVLAVAIAIAVSTNTTLRLV